MLKSSSRLSSGITSSFYNVLAGFFLLRFFRFLGLLLGVISALSDISSMDPIPILAIELRLGLRLFPFLLFFLVFICMANLKVEPLLRPLEKTSIVPPLAWTRLLQVESSMPMPSLLEVSLLVDSYSANSFLILINSSWLRPLPKSMTLTCSSSSVESYAVLMSTFELWVCFNAFLVKLIMTCFKRI